MVFSGKILEVLSPPTGIFFSMIKSMRLFGMKIHLKYFMQGMITGILQKEKTGMKKR